MSSASPVATSTHVRRINWRLALRWMCANAAGVVILGTRTLMEYRAHGFHASTQLETFIAAHLVLIVIVGMAQAAVYCWAFSYVSIAERNICGAVGALLGLLSGPVFALLGALSTNVGDIAVGVWIFAPTGLVFGWLVAVSQADQTPRKPVSRVKAEEKQRHAVNITPQRHRTWRMNWRLMGWWMCVNTMGLFVAVMLLEINSQGYSSGALFLLLLLAALGVLHAVVGSLMISLIRFRNKTAQIALGVAVGIITGILAVFLGLFFLWIYAVLGLWVFIPSGIIFGWLIASQQPVRGIHSI